MAARIEYQIVGRYMDGKEVTGYHLQSLESGKSGRYTREQVAYLVGRGQITNCTGQIYQDKLLLRGVGMSLDSLPVKQENGDLSRTGNIGKVRKGTSAADAMTQLMIVGTIRNGRNTVGYVLKNSAGATKKGSRADVIKLASEGRIGNARVQNSGDKVILRGVNCNLDELPVTNIESTTNAQVNKSSDNKPNKPNKPNGIAGIINQDMFGSVSEYDKMLTRVKASGGNLHRLNTLNSDEQTVLHSILFPFMKAATTRCETMFGNITYYEDKSMGSSFKYIVYMPIKYNSDSGIKLGVLNLCTSHLKMKTDMVISMSLGTEEIIDSGIVEVRPRLGCVGIEEYMQGIKELLDRA